MRAAASPGGHASHHPASGGTFVLPLVVALGVLAWVAFRLGTGIVLEDALITYRYAEHVATGQGFTFNPGERVLGTTTPLFTLLLAAFGLLFGPGAIPSASVAIAIACAAATAVLSFAVVRAWGFGERAAGIVAFAYVLHPDVLWSTAGGMETALVVFWMALGLWAITRDRGALAAVSAAMLVLSRPDGLVWATLVLAARFASRGRAAFRELGVFLLVLLPWVAFAIAYFGSAVPHSLVAKTVHAGGAGALELLRPSSLRSAAVAFAEWLPVAPGAGIAPLGFVAGLIALVAGVRQVAARGPRPVSLVLLAFPPLFALAYYVGRAPTAFPWYGLPVTWALLIPAGVGAARLLERALRPHAGRRAEQIALAGLALAVAAGWGIEIARTYRYEKEFQQNEVATRRAIGVWLDANAPREATVAMEAIGYQGVHSKRYVIDLAGLVSPRVTAIRRTSATNAEAFARVIEELEPDFLVLRAFEIDENRNRDGGRMFETTTAESTFHVLYHERLRRVAPYPGRWGRASELTVYERREPLS